MFSQDFVINRGGTLQGQGPIGTLLANSRIDPGLHRPYIGEDGHSYVTVFTGRKDRKEIKNKLGIVTNIKHVPVYEQVRTKELGDLGINLPDVTRNATLRRDEWIMYDSAVRLPNRERLRFYDDIARVNTFSFSGLGVKMLEHETMSDPGRAYMDMDGLSEGTDDTPLFQLEGQPIPIFHANFTLDLRTLESSRRGGTPLSTRGVEWATRRVRELVETNAIGVAGSPLLYGDTSHGGYSRTPGVYGLLNFPDRMTKTDLTVPTGANPQAVYDDVLEMRELMYAANFYGPYGIYHSTDYDRYLDAPYAYSDGSGWGINPAMTLRQALMNIGTEGGDEAGRQNQISWVKRLDYLTPANSHAFTMVMVSLNGNNIRALNGMPMTVFQYETRGGWQMHFRVACINLVEMFADYNGNCGILHARSA